MHVCACACIYEKMVDRVGRGSAASGLSRPRIKPRLKPTIYETVDGKIIVEDEFLNFLSVKIKTMSQDQIILVASNTFDSEWIESSKKNCCLSSVRALSNGAWHVKAVRKM